MRRILCVPLLLALAGSATAAATAPAAPSRASGSVVGATVAVSGEPAPASTPARAAAVAQPAAAAAADDPAPVARAAASGSVTIRDFSFGPSAITVHVGDTVTWANAGPTDHTATADDGGFDTGTLKAGQSGSHTFASAGTFAYHCTLHPSMRGTVDVVGVAPAAPAPTRSSPAATAPATPAAPTLPKTGFDAPVVAALGVLSLLCGLVLRARTRPR